jgi:hypothetical protein
MIESFPANLPPPEPFIRLFQWLEANSLAEKSPYDGQWYAKLDPAIDRACILVTPVEPGFAEAWCGEAKPEAQDRLAAFVRTGGDGSYAGLWKDDDGNVSIVHQGSGSGSTLLCKLTDNPIDFLRILAIGYEELCWQDAYGLAPQEAFQNGWDDDEVNIPLGPIQPVRFQRWVSESYGVSIPRTASEIVKSTSGIDDAASADPFWNWIRKIQSQ